MMGEASLTMISLLKDQAILERRFEVAACLRAAEVSLKKDLFKEWTDELINKATQEKGIDIETIDPPY
jgi:predicted transcriptional regulator